MWTFGVWGLGFRVFRATDLGFRVRGFSFRVFITNALRVQVPNNHILTQNMFYKYYYPKPKHLIIGYLSPVGSRPFAVTWLSSVVANMVQAAALETESSNNMSYSLKS